MSVIHHRLALPLSAVMIAAGALSAPAIVAPGLIATASAQPAEDRPQFLYPERQIYHQYPIALVGETTLMEPQHLSNPITGEPIADPAAAGYTFELRLADGDPRAHWISLEEDGTLVLTPPANDDSVWATGWSTQVVARHENPDMTQFSYVDFDIQTAENAALIGEGMPAIDVLPPNTPIAKATTHQEWWHQIYERGTGAELNKTDFSYEVGPADPGRGWVTPEWVSIANEEGELTLSPGLDATEGVHTVPITVTEKATGNQTIVPLDFTVAPTMIVPGNSSNPAVWFSAGPIEAVRYIWMQIMSTIYEAVMSSSYR